VVIICISIGIYANTLRNGFVFDDEGTIVENSMIKNFGNLQKLFQADYFSRSGEMSYRPIVTFSYFLDYAAFGLKPWGYHLTNIILHVVNGVLLYTFLTLLFQPSAANWQPSDIKEMLYSRSFLISLLFATHSVLTEAVNAISFREDLLVFLFYISTLSLYLLLKRNSAQSLTTYLLYSISCFFYFLGLLSKEMAATLPLVVFCYEWLYADKEKGRMRSILFNHYNIGYMAVTLIYLYIRFYHFQNPIVIFTPHWPLMTRLFTVSWLLLNYIKFSAFPVSLVADYRISPVTSPLSFVIPLIAASILLIILRLGRKEAIFGALFFFVTLTPVYNLIPISNPFAERYLYLPMAGFLIAMAFAIRAEFNKIQKVSILMLILTIITFNSLSVIRRNSVWMDNESLWSDTVRKMPNSSLAHLNLGIVYFRQGKFEIAESEYRLSSGLNPEDPRPYNNLAVIYDMKGQLDEAVLQFYNALRLSPGNPKYHYGLANVFYKQKRFDEAKEEYSIALKQNPNPVERHHIN